MARWGLWTASAIGAAGAGAALALVRRRRPAGEAATGAPVEGGVPAPAAAGGAPPEDPREALDAARDRLRARADALRDEIARRGEEPPAEG